MRDDDRLFPEEDLEGEADIPRGEMRRGDRPAAPPPEGAPRKASCSCSTSRPNSSSSDAFGILFIIIFYLVKRIW